MIGRKWYVWVEWVGLLEFLDCLFLHMLVGFL